MKASDFIVAYIIEKGVTDVFGYPGGMVTHLMDSFGKYSDRISTHVMYHEQGAALAACGFAQATGITGVAYATSGPGATNLITGICNAYMDSIPVIFITGQVNSFEQRGNLAVRQRGFQETDIVAMVSGITKFAVKINNVESLKYNLDYAFHIANAGRKGPVLLDIAMDVFRSDLEIGQVKSWQNSVDALDKDEKWEHCMLNMLKEAKRPVVLLGNGLETNAIEKNVEIFKELSIPVVTSMLSVEKQRFCKNYYGFIGAYGSRVANFIVAKSDLVISIGARMDIRQVGANREKFAENAKLIRFDIDQGELEYKVHKEEVGIQLDVNTFFSRILNVLIDAKPNISNWVDVCKEIRDKLNGYDDRTYNAIIRKISEYIPEGSIVTTDVGQNQVWIAQSFLAKANQRILFSGGHGAMGYSLPASIGACIGTGKNVYAFQGDGGFQMNLQELQVISREKLPIKLIVFNNRALGMIRHFQEMYFNKNYVQTTEEGGYESPDFQLISKAYNMKYVRIENVLEVETKAEIWTTDVPTMIEVVLEEETYVFPKLEFGKPNQDQEPKLNRTLYNYLMDL